MSDLAQLTDRNRVFATGFEDGGLPIPPRLSTIVLTCLDARVDPGHFFDLQLGDSFVIRNAGGRVTPCVANDLAVLSVLTGAAEGGFGRELVIVHHTDCGMTRFTDAETCNTLAERLGIEPAEVAATMAITDPVQSVRDDIQRLSEMSAVPGGLLVSGLVYDVVTGTVEEIVATAPLRAA